MRQGFKLGVSLAGITLSAGFLQSHAESLLYPWLPLSVGIAAILLVAVSVFFDTRGLLSIVSIISLSVLFRVQAFLFPESMVAFDPDAHAVRSQVIIDSGSLDAIVSGFYHFASIFNIFGAEVSLISNLPVETAYIVYPFTSGLLFPLYTVVMVRRVTNDQKGIVVAATITAVGASTTIYSIAPVPLTLAAIYLTGAVSVLVIINDTVNSRSLFIIGVFILAAAGTHKIPVAIFVAITGAVLVYFSLVNRWTIDLRPSITRILLLAVLLLTFQWIYWTSYIDNSAIRVFTIINSDISLLSSPGSATQPPAAAKPVVTPLSNRVFNTLYITSALGIGFFSAVELFREYKMQQINILHCAAAVTGVIVVSGILLPDAPGFPRMFVYATPFIATLIGIGVSRLYSSELPAARQLTAIIIIVLVVSNPASAVAWPDSTDSWRSYLSSEEVKAKQFSNKMISDPVQMDMYYGDEVVDFQTGSQIERSQRTVPQPQWDERLMSEELLDGSMLNHQYQYIALRTEVDIYRLKDGSFRLSWNPVRTTESSTKYHQIYDNGGVKIFSHNE